LLVASADWQLLSGLCGILHVGNGDVELSAANEGSLSLDACQGSDCKFSVKVVECFSFVPPSNDNY
jgi:hypothetical protein